MSEEKNKVAEISDLGEFGLIKHLTKDIKLVNTSSVYGVGDDAAVLDYVGKQMVITTDLLTEGIHFDLMYTPLKHLGYKAAVVNFSDVYAMNGIPKQMTIALAISRKFSLKAIEELYEGIKLACEKYGVDLVGGDTSSSLTGMTISVTVVGEVDKEKIVYRKGAQINDLICVTGDLGSAYLGLLLLKREQEVFKIDPNMQPLLEGYDYILERFLKPEARKEIIEFFAEKGIQPTSMIDISDGLSSEILHICKQSKTGCRIYQEKIPIDAVASKMADEFNIEPTVAALNGGEDYELLFTMPLKDYDLVSQNPAISIIGHITSAEDGCNLITNAEQEIEIKAQGWNGLEN
ncbi:MAG: thiamine-phosphate kinase [Bacteroidales bacterium]|nr:thiamine-phosphate kinase [Bacteroidales bacterium]MCF8457441.1 thiamine-phosphate kinase [Bacteroidales bacterium]